MSLTQAGTAPWIPVDAPVAAPLFSGMAKRPVMILVSGGAEANAATLAMAESVGEGLAEAGAVVLTGGLGGVMEAASRGAKRGGGTTVGVVPGMDRGTANIYVDVAIASGMTHGRNVILAHSADGVIALAGSYGTLSEIALALVMGKPVVSLGSWEPDERVQRAADPADAVRKILDACGRK